MLKAMLFDVDGVLVLGDRWDKHLSRDYGITEEMTQQFFTSRFGACVTGKADLKEEIAPFLRQWQWAGTVDDFLQHWFSSSREVNQPLLAYIRQLRSQGQPCYIATMQEQYRTAYLLEEMGFAQEFDGMFSSAYIGHMKSKPEFYHHILHKLTPMQAEEIIFWDDTPHNVATAREVGIQAEVYTDFESFQTVMQAYLK